MGEWDGSGGRNQPSAALGARMARTKLMLLAMALLAFIADANAQRSYFKLYDQNQGLAAGEIAALAQDDDGYIWIGAHRGLLRFDGHEFLRWAPQQLNEVVYELVYGPDDQLLARTASGRGFRRTAAGLLAIAGTDGPPVAPITQFQFDASGQLWAIIDRQLWRPDRGMRSPHPAPQLCRET